MVVPVPTKLSTMGEAEIDHLRVPACTDSAVDFQSDVHDMFSRSAVQGSWKEDGRIMTCFPGLFQNDVHTQLKLSCQVIRS